MGEQPVFDGERQRTNLDRLASADCLDGGGVDISPELDDVGVGVPPRIHQRLQLGLGQAHAQGSHSFQRTNTALITTGEHCDLSFLAQLTVGSVFVDGDTEYAGGGFSVELLALRNASTVVDSPASQAMTRASMGLSGLLCTGLGLEVRG